MMETQISPADWANAIAQRAGCYGLGDWLPGLMQWLGDVQMPHWSPPDNDDNDDNDDSDDESPIAIISPAKGIRFTLAAMPGYHILGPQLRSGLLVLDNIVFDAARIAELAGQSTLPFGLSRQGETPQTVADKLGTTDTTGGKGAPDERISYFLDDLRVVEITFAEHARIRQVLVTRLWQPVLFDE